MDELDNPMEKMTKNVPRLTFQHYVLKKNGYNHHLFHRDFDVNKLIFCKWYPHIVLHFNKPVLKYNIYHLDSFEKKVDANI